MERTPLKILHATYTIEVTSWNLHLESYLMKHTPRKLPHGTYTLEGTSWNLHHGS